MADDKNQEDSENFGLPDIEYKPLEQLDSSKSTEETAPIKDSSTSETPPPYYEEEEEEGSKSGVIITLIVGLVIVVGGFLAYKYIWVPKQEKAKLELLKQKREAKEKATADSLARGADEERLKLEAAANSKQGEGTIGTLSDRTVRY